MLVAQITDTHILGAGKLFHSPRRAIPADAEPGWSFIDTAAYLTRAIAELNHMRPRPDIVVVTGDLTDHGGAEEYTNLRAILAAAEMPVYVIPGNHDSREGVRATFASDGYLPHEGFLHYVVEGWPLRIVALDTHVPGSHHGELCAERLDWLDRTLSGRPSHPTLVMMHHPPFPTGIEHMDAHALYDPAAFAAVVRRHPQIERILCGHLHRTIDHRFAGTIAGTAPATAHQLILDMTPGAPAEFTFEPPGYQLHFWREGVGLVTHTAVFGDWPGPFPYRAPPG
ncbi:MAG TPA: phosphodiesterase [Stellaceae bacterium]|jgi:3',5'-cyclic AMP phosphodiesterase CpdA|nr:phosphodiesterase [Stellaceae bacterium]